MPRKHETRMITSPAAEAAGLQIETVLPRPVGGRRQPAARRPRLGPVAPRLPRVTRLMALAIKFQDMVARGEVRDYADIARLGHITRARATQLMNLLHLAPDIQENLLFPAEDGVTSEATERDLRSIAASVHWGVQRKLWRPLHQPGVSRAG